MKITSCYRFLFGWFSVSITDDDFGKYTIILYIVGLVFLILSPIVSKIIQLAVSRKREYLADATSVEFTRNPKGLISALRKLDADNSTMKNYSNATAHMYINDPNGKTRKKKKSSLFSTHPSIDERIARLEHIN